MPPLPTTCVWPPGLEPRAQLARMDRWEARTGVELVALWETLHSHFSDCGLGAPAVHCGGGLTMCCNNYTHIGVHFLYSLITTRHMEVHN